MGIYDEWLASRGSSREADYGAGYSAPTTPAPAPTTPGTGFMSWSSPSTPAGWRPVQTQGSGVWGWPSAWGGNSMLSYQLGPQLDAMSLEWFQTLLRNALAPSAWPR